MFQPRIVYNPSQNNYLLGYGEGLDAISVVRLSTIGQLIGTAKSFSGPPNSFNSLDGIVGITDSTDFMFFWSKSIFINKTGDSRRTLMAQRVSASGDLVGASQTVVKEGIYSFGSPPVVYNPIRREFLALIAGKEKLPLIIEFKAVRLGPDGRAIEPPHIVGTVDSRWPPAISFNTLTGRYALFYARNDDLYFRELGPLGKSIGKEILMSCTKRNRSLPGLLFDPRLRQYFGYWTHVNAKTAFDVYARTIKSTSPISQ
jgi:hypothetical protein